MECKGKRQSLSALSHIYPSMLAHFSNFVTPVAAGEFNRKKLEMACVLLF